MLKKSDPHSSASAIISFLVVLLAFSIFIIFNVNKDTLLQPDVKPTFMILTTVGMGLLIGLVYLVNQSTSKHTSKAKSTPHKKKKR